MTAPVDEPTEDQPDLPITIDDLPPECHNKEVVVFLLQMVDRLSKGIGGPIDALLVLLADSTKTPPAIGLSAHRLDAAASRIVLSAALEYTNQAAKRTQSGIILPGR